MSYQWFILHYRKISGYFSRTHDKRTWRAIKVQTRAMKPYFVWVIQNSWVMAVKDVPISEVYIKRDKFPKKGREFSIFQSFFEHGSTTSINQIGEKWFHGRFLYICFGDNSFYCVDLSFFSFVFTFPSHSNYSS